MRSFLSSLTLVALSAGAYAQAPVASPLAAAPKAPAQLTPPTAPFGNASAPAAPRPLPTGLTAAGLPDLSAQSLTYPKGPDSDTALILSQLAAGRYNVTVAQHAHFPNRTLYLPTGVSRIRRIPILAWENGSCYVYGRMYEAFLREIASHGYLVVAPGPPNSLVGSSSADWQTTSIDLARSWNRRSGAPFRVDRDSVAVAGHSCGGGETMRNLANDTDGLITTGIILNAAGQSPASVFANVSAPMLWVHGGKNDTEAAMDANMAWVKQNKRRLPVFEVGLQTGHLGSFWSARGGIYSETVVRWLDWQLKDDWRAEEWFTEGKGGPESAAAKRGWKVQANAID